MPRRPDRKTRIVAALPRWVAFGAIALWTLTFWRLGALRQDRWGTFGFDLGIYDQASWLLAHFRDPFMTVRGLDVFGHHGTFALWLHAPGYWLGWGPKWLLGVQLAAQVAGAVALWALARRVVVGRFRDWCAAGLVVTYLLHPTSGWLVWEYFHPDVVALGALLVGWWAARASRWRWCWAAMVFALACKEDLATAVAMFGFLVVVGAFGRDRSVRRGGAFIAVAGAWYLAVNKVLIPWRNGGADDFYTQQFFGQLGDSPLQVVANLVLHPVRSKTWDRIFGPDARDYYWSLLAPVAVFVPFVEAQVLLLAAPMVLINVVSAQAWTHDPRFHYTAIPLAAIMLATVEAVGIVSRRPGRRSDVAAGAVVLVLVASSALMYRAEGIGPGAREFRKGWWPMGSAESVADVLLGVDPHDDPVAAAKDAVLRSLPDDASVSAWYSMVPHVSSRVAAYEWPNPFGPSNWGIRDHDQHLPSAVDWILLDRAELNQTNDTGQRLLFDALLATGEFRIVARRTVGDAAAPTADIVLARRQRPPGCLPDPTGEIARRVSNHYAIVAPPSTGTVCPVT